jgi:hypothetical protein
LVFIEGSLQYGLRDAENWLLRAPPSYRNLLNKRAQEYLVRWPQQKSEKNENAAQQILYAASLEHNLDLFMSVVVTTGVFDVEYAKEVLRHQDPDGYKE